MGMGKHGERRLSRDYHGLRVLTENEIWNAAEQVFKKFPSSKIASGFIQAYMLCDKIIEHRGDKYFVLGAAAESEQEFQSIIPRRTKGTRKERW